MRKMVGFGLQENANSQDGGRKRMRRDAHMMESSFDRKIGRTRRSGIARRIAAAAVSAMMALGSVLPASAVEGSMGYEGGIATADRFTDATYAYTEAMFVTGEPILLTGTLAIKKSVKNSTISATYTYKLTNTARSASLTRVLIYETVLETKSNGQVSETTRLTKLPTEVLTVGSVVYTLISYDFSRSALKDPKPAVDYTAGETSGKKVYRVGSGTTAPTVTVENASRMYAFDEYWSSTQTQIDNLTITYEEKSGTTTTRWGGTAKVTVSGAGRQRFTWMDNEPWSISFDGGYVRTTWNEGQLAYEAKLPEFDKNGDATDVLVKWSNTASLESEPLHERLMAPDLSQLDGHQSKDAISILYGLEVVPGDPATYNPSRYLTRAEYVAMVMNAIKDVPADPSLRTSAARTTRTTTVAESPFLDVSIDDEFYSEIEDAANRGVIYGRGQAYFRPDAHVTKGEAVAILIRAIGLESLSTAPSAVAPFLDSDQIPSWFRASATVASQIGLLGEDTTGVFGASSLVTGEQAALYLYRLIQYMGDDMIRDYRERVIEY